MAFTVNLEDFFAQMNFRTPEENERIKNKKTGPRRGKR